ncbi:MAG: hypothetical protein DI533_04560 [Cereibacter sphaeroides]|uniref:Uncharacterized protein n=1 Tax=Cereibacter sphaeroides TaxID=1063 RepID=A0A2W5SA72_CERSP|nr:MAG: hypothetical protein DI533_04560 [Cereibacter sphaeroides]
MVGKNPLAYEGTGAPVQLFDRVEFNWNGRRMDGLVLRANVRTRLALVAFRLPEPRPLKHNGARYPRTQRRLMRRRDIQLIARDDRKRSRPA